MGLLDFIRSDEVLAENVQLDDKKIVSIWNNYLRTFEEKGKVIFAIREDNMSQSIIKLRVLLDTELIDISQSGDLEEDIIEDLKNLEHSENIKRIHKLQRCLGYAETTYEYVHALMKKLYSIIILEVRCANKENFNISDVDELKNLYDLELEVVNKTENLDQTKNRESFQEVFISLVIGERIIKRMNKTEKRLMRSMKRVMDKVFSTDEDEQISEGLIHDWVADVVNAIDDKIGEGIADLLFSGDNEDINLEFVNKPQFVDLVREKRRALTQDRISEESIKSDFIPGTLPQLSAIFF